MQRVTVPTTKGKSFEVIYNLNDFPYQKFKNFNTVVRGGRENYFNIPAAFDIEVTTIDRRKIGQNPTGFMYNWQFCLDKYVIMGRTWDEYLQFIDKLQDTLIIGDSKVVLPVYVHNLAYEFQFMQSFIEVDSMFAKSKRKPLKVKSGFIEYRCSYFLSNMSFEKFCENSKGCTHQKLKSDKGFTDFDYSKLRTPYTELTNDELAYCYNDVRGLCECIRNRLEEDTLATIPMTATGYIRRKARQAMAKNKRNRSNFEKCALLPHQYKLARSAFRGGLTHASRFFADEKIDNVYSFDISSSYPAQMLFGYYPVTKFTDVTLDTQEKLDKYTSEYCVIMKVAFYDIELKPNIPMPYIDIAHCERSSNIINDNGRVLSADYIEAPITEIDLEIIREQYHYSGLQVNQAMYSKRGSLPKELLEMMLESYDKKTQLKDVDGMEYEYGKSKNEVNAYYGMLVTDILHGTVTFDNGNWDETKPDSETGLTKYYRSRNSFLTYQWGIYVTCHARRQLHDMLNLIGMDAIYCDTDCIKFINIENCKLFDEMNIKLRKRAEESSIRGYSDRVTDAGCLKRFYLGTWDFDGYALQFKTLGAKKYVLYQWKNCTLELKTTISGMNKELTPLEMKTIDNFTYGTVFTKVKHTTSWYNDVEPYEESIIMPDSDHPHKFINGSNIGILETPYELGITGEYFDIISKYKISA